MRKKTVKSAYYCPSCKEESMVINEKAGTYVCTHCGRVSKTPVFDLTSEYRNFAIEHGVKDKSRASYGGSEDFTDLGTSIADTKLARLHQQITVDPKVASLKRELHAIQDLATQRLELGRNIAYDAKKIYKEAIEKELTKNYKKEARRAVCIYFACKKNHKTIDKNEILKDLENVTEKEFENVAKAWHELSPTNEFATAELTERYANTLLGNLTFITKAIYAVAKKVTELTILAGKRPDSVAGACIYFFCESYLLPEYRRPCEEIAKVCGGQSKDTIIKHSKGIFNLKQQFDKLPEVKEVCKEMERIESKKRNKQ